MREVQKEMERQYRGSWSQSMDECDSKSKLSWSQSMDESDSKSKLSWSQSMDESDSKSKCLSRVVEAICQQWHGRLK